jgi:hypothetical protein
MIFLLLTLLSIAAALYALFLRSWLKRQSWAEGFFAWVEPYEVKLWKNSETIFFARFKMAVGTVLQILTAIGEIDMTIFMPIIRPDWQPYVLAFLNVLPMLLIAVGWIDEKLRNGTTKPLELVAIAEADITIDQAEAMRAAEAAKAEAVNVLSFRRAA